VKIPFPQFLRNSLTCRFLAKQSSNGHEFASPFLVSEQRKLQRSLQIRETLAMETSEISVGSGKLLMAATLKISVGSEKSDLGEDFGSEMRESDYL
jgi:hypothetical protein